MKKIRKNRKHFKKVIPIFLIIALFLLTPLTAKANMFTNIVVGLFSKGISSLSPMSIARAIIVTLLDFVFSLFSKLLTMAGSLFDAMIDVGFQNHNYVVKAGWEVTRDVANMVFILFMVVVAFATILRNEQYGFKKLLPKVIMLALLINFSLLFCSIIIDLSNLTANFFIKETRENITQGGFTGFSSKFADSLNLTRTKMLINCDDLEDEESKQLCEENKSTLQQIGGGVEDFTSYLLSLTVGSIVILIATFVFFAGAIMLIARIVIIWFLVILAPLVLICYIVPSLRKNWLKWWSTFLQWCFFAPAFAFFIWLAIKISIEGSIKAIQSGSMSNLSNDGVFSNIFMSAPATGLLQYIFVIALLLGGLIVSKNFGIYGANTAINIGQKMKKGATKWIGARARERAAKPMDKLAQGTGKLYGATLGRIPIIKGLGLGKIAQLPARVMQNQQKDIANEKTKLSSHSPDALKSLYSTFTRTQQIAAAQILAEKGKLSAKGHFTEGDIQKVTQTAKAYGAEGPLIESRIDLAESVGKTIEETLTKVISKGKLKEMQPVSFDTPQGIKVLKALMKLSVTPGIFRTRFMSMPLNSQEAAAKTMRQMFLDENDDERNKYRPFYAAATGDIDIAFATENELKIYEEKKIDKEPYQIQNVEKELLKKFVSGMKAKDFQEISPSSIRAVAESVEASEAKEFGKNISGDLKKEFIKQWKEQKSGPEKINELKDHPAWKSYIERPASAAPQKAEDIKVKKARENLENM